jgi:hypothetical protein
MTRSKKPEQIETARRLAAVRTMIADMEDAMPSHARELRRGAKEELDEIIARLAPQSAFTSALARHIDGGHE